MAARPIAKQTDENVCAILNVVGAVVDCLILVYWRGFDEFDAVGVCDCLIDRNG
jgi:hypothetical protein